MANKQDVFNAYYEGVCTMLSAAYRSGSIDTLLDSVDHQELRIFLETNSGLQYSYLIKFDADGNAFAT